VRAAEQRQIQRAEGAVALLTVIACALTLFGAWVITGSVTWLHAIAAVATGTVGLHLGLRTVRQTSRQFPVGATNLLDAAKLNGCGEVIGESTLCSPATGTLCVAYAVELRLAGNGQDRVMYRDAVTSGFEIQLDDGSRARVPKGRIRLVGDMREAMDLDNPELESYLAEIDGRRRPDTPYDPFRYNVVYESLVLPGDRIELLSAFEPRVNAKAPSTLYRKSMPSVLWPRTVPRIRQLTSTI